MRNVLASNPFPHVKFLFPPYHPPPDGFQVPQQQHLLGSDSGSDASSLTSSTMAAAAAAAAAAEGMDGNRNFT